MKRKYKRNAVTNDDIVHFALAGITGVALGFIIARQGPTPVAGLRGLRGPGEYFREPMSGLGSYYHDPVNIPFSGLGVNGLGANYVRTR